MRAGLWQLRNGLRLGLQKVLLLPTLVRGPGGGALLHARTRHRLLILTAALLVCSYALGVLAYVVSMPEIGVRCAFTPVVNHFYDEFLYPAGQEPMRAEDRIVRLADLPIDNWSQLLRKLNNLRKEEPAPVRTWSPADFRTGEGPVAGKTHLRLLDQNVEVVRVEYERTDAAGRAERHVAWCRLGHSPVETLLPSVLWFFLKIGLFVVGAFVFWKRPGDRSAAQFFWLCIVSFGAYIGGYHWSRIVTQPVLLLVFMVCATLVPPVSLHFYLLFPRPKGVIGRHPRRVLLAVYGPAVIFLLLLLTGYVEVRYLYQGGTTAGAEPGAVRAQLQVMLYEIYCYFGVAALWYLASVACLVHSYRTAAGVTERNQVKCLLFGAAIALMPIGYSLYLAYLQKGRFGGGAATWPMFAASACVTVAYAVSITRYGLMQLDQIVSSGFVYFLISFVAGLVYYALVFAGMVLVGSQFGEGPSLAHVLAVSGTALLLVVALDLARGRLRRVLDRHFRREKHQLDRTLQRMSQAIERLVDPPALGRRLLHTSADLLNVARGAVYLRRDDPSLYHLADALGPTPPLAELSSGCPLVEALRADGVVAAGPRPAPEGPAQRQLRFLGGELARALLHEGQLLGFLSLGPREQAPYTAEELNLLGSFAQLIALALVSAEGHRTIDVLNRELQAKVEKIAEQQRRILALQSQLTSRAAQAEDGAPAGDGRPAENGEATHPAPDLPDGMVGSSPQVQQLMRLVRKVAASESAVLLRGESGTGKELLARALHESSPRAARPFVKVHCAALSAGLLESELFGHVKGAFTSAIRDKVGRFEAAHGGTLFLDEIGDINLETQTKLLRVLQEKTFERVGSSAPLQVDVRIIAATHQDLESLIRQGRFREDLYYRLNVFPIALPPLRERAEDVPELALYFLRLYSRRAGKQVLALDDDALALLKAYHWPGNVRQLENVIERAVVIAEKPVVTADELPPELLADADPAPAAAFPAFAPSAALDGSPPEDAATVIEAGRAERERRECEQLVRALAAAGGNKAEAARALGIARSTLVSKLKRLGLS